ncbi:MAG: DUF3313 domain-containing protein [Proteobacteria bacterium]|nr:DUF3313 domain-containing protein [Pseudomonadota bacterium]
MSKTQKMLPLIALIASSGLLTGCAGSNPTVDTSAEAEISFDGLYRVKGGTADAAWVRKGADISQYSKIMLQGVGIEYRPGGESGRLYYSRRSADHFEISDKQKERLVEILTEAFRKELGKSEHFTIVSEPGPDVLLIRGALLDVVSFVPPEPIGRGEIFLSRVGEATLVLEIRDSVSDAILVRAVDRRAAEDAARGFSRSNRVFNAAEVRRMAQAWARKLRERLDEYAAK